MNLHGHCSLNANSSYTLGSHGGKLHRGVYVRTSECSKLYYQGCNLTETDREHQKKKQKKPKTLSNYYYFL